MILQIHELESLIHNQAAWRKILSWPVSEEAMYCYGLSHDRLIQFCTSVIVVSIDLRTQKLEYGQEHCWQQQKFPHQSSYSVWFLILWLEVYLQVYFSGTTKILWTLFSSVQFSHSVVSDSLRPHELQHARPLCPSPTPGVHSDSRPSSQWYHPVISSSVVPFSSCPQSLPASESFPMSQRFTWGGQSTWVSALASFLPKKSQGWDPLEWTGWISLQSMELSRVFSNTTVQMHQFFSTQLSSQSNSHIHTWTLEKP